MDIPPIFNSCINRFLKAKTSDRIKEPQFGPKQKDIFIKLPYKGQQSDIVKRQLTRLYAKVAPRLKLNFMFFASDRIKRLSKLKILMSATCCQMQSCYL